MTETNQNLPSPGLKEAIELNYVSGPGELVLLRRRMLSLITITIAVLIGMLAIEQLCLVSVWYRTPVNADGVVMIALGILEFVADLLAIAVLFIAPRTMIARPRIAIAMGVRILLGSLRHIGVFFILLLDLTRSISLNKILSYALISRVASVAVLCASSYLCLLLYDAWSDSRKLGQSIP